MEHHGAAAIAGSLMLNAPRRGREFYPQHKPTPTLRVARTRQLAQLAAYNQATCAVASALKIHPMH